LSTSLNSSVPPPHHHTHTHDREREREREREKERDMYTHTHTHTHTHAHTDGATNQLANLQQTTDVINTKQLEEAYLGLRVKGLG